MEPRLENVVAKRSGRVSVAKVNIDDLGELAAKYDVILIVTTGHDGCKQCDL